MKTSKETNQTKAPVPRLIKAADVAARKAATQVNKSVIKARELSVEAIINRARIGSRRDPKAMFDSLFGDKPANA